MRHNVEEGDSQSLSPIVQYFDESEPHFAHEGEYLDRINTLEEQLARAHRTISSLEAKLEEFKKMGWNKARGVKLRRLETFYSRFSNAMAQEGINDAEMISRLKAMANQELKYLPENPWNDSETSKTQSV